MTARSIVIGIDDPDHEHLVFDAVEDGPLDGELVLLLHGFPQTKHSYRRQIPALAAAGYRVVAVDQRGYSPGARPTGVEAYRIGVLVRDVLALAGSLGADRFHLVGHDYGAVAQRNFGKVIVERNGAPVVLERSEYIAHLQQVSNHE